MWVQCCILLVPQRMRGAITEPAFTSLDDNIKKNQKIQNKMWCFLIILKWILNKQKKTKQKKASLLKSDTISWDGSVNDFPDKRRIFLFLCMMMKSWNRDTLPTSLFPLSQKEKVLLCACVAMMLIKTKKKKNKLFFLFFNFFFHLIWFISMQATQFWISWNRIAQC